MGVRYREMLLVVVRAAARQGLLVLVALHRLRRTYATPTAAAEWPGAWDGWWYDDAAKLPEAQVAEHWGQVASYFCTEWNVFGADIFNEPAQVDPSPIGRDTPSAP